MPFLCPAIRAFRLRTSGRRSWLAPRPARRVDRDFYFSDLTKQRISLSVVRGVNRAIRSHLATLSARLARA